MLRRSFLALPALLHVSGCATTSPRAGVSPPFDAQAAVEQLRLLDERSGATDNSEGQNLISLFGDQVVAFAVPVPGFAHGKAEVWTSIQRAIGGQTRLRWRPLRAGISADGQHGFTLGYMIAGADQAPAGHYKYVAYWVRRTEGWRIAVYKIVPRPPEAIAVTSLAPSLPNSAPPFNATPELREQTRATLAAREREFSDAAQNVGLSRAFALFGGSDAVNVGGGAEFVVDADNIAAIHPDGPSPLYWSADQGVLVADSGDLGVTWGFLHRNGPTPPGRLAEIPFFTIWRRQSASAPWLYIAE